MTNLPEPRCQDGSAFAVGPLVRYDLRLRPADGVSRELGVAVFDVLTEEGWAFLLEGIPDDIARVMREDNLKPCVPPEALRNMITAAVMRGLHVDFPTPSAHTQGDEN